MTIVRFKNRPADKTFNTFMSDFFKDSSFLLKDNFPAPYSKQVAPVNISEKEKHYELEVVAPGFSKEDFKLNLEDNLLTISAEKKNEVEDKTEKQIRKEYQYQSFKRSFTIDENLDAENINAQYVNGVLTLNLPKKEVVKEAAKQISIQ